MCSVRSDIQVVATGCIRRIPSARKDAVLSDLMIIIIEEKLKLL